MATPSSSDNLIDGSAIEDSSSSSDLDCGLSIMEVECRLSVMEHDGVASVIRVKSGMLSKTDNYVIFRFRFFCYNKI